MSERRFCTRPIEPADPSSGFRSGTRPLDDYFERYAISNHQEDVGRAYVIEATAEQQAAGLPLILGFYTLSMAVVASQDASLVLDRRLPRYPMPVALIGRLAVDNRARRRGIGESLLLDALARAMEAAHVIACLGVVVDAKDAAAEAFYAKYDFVTVDDSRWPRRLFLPMHMIRAAFSTD